jgi:hypothetical protein
VNPVMSNDAFLFACLAQTNNFWRDRTNPTMRSEN